VRLHHNTFGGSSQTLLIALTALAGLAVMPSPGRADTAPKFVRACSAGVADFEDGTVVDLPNEAAEQAWEAIATADTPDIRACSAGDADWGLPSSPASDEAAAQSVAPSEDWVLPAGTAIELSLPRRVDLHHAFGGGYCVDAGQPFGGCRRGALHPGRHRAPCGRHGDRGKDRVRLPAPR